MPENFVISTHTTKRQQYQELLPQLEALVKYEIDLIANLANMSAALHQAFGFLWVGFYLIKESELVLGPFQGPIACTRIAKGKGVCGKAWEQEKPLIVPNVSLFEGHIACSSLAKSEIVIPFYNNNQLIGVLDIDSAELNTFDKIDEQYLSQILSFL